MKKIFSSLAIAGLIGFTGCEAPPDDELLIEDPVVEQPAPAPAVTEPVTPPPPIGQDTVMADTMEAEEDTAAPVTP